jgi:adenylate cyclase
VSRSPQSSNAPETGRRFEQAVAAFLRQEFGASVTAILGFVDILLEDARARRLDDIVPDLERMRVAGTQLAALIAQHLDPDPGRLDAGAAFEEYKHRLRHDLRTPLTAIIGYGELVLEDAHGSVRAAVISDLNKVLGLAGRMLEEIDRLVEMRGEGEAPAAGSVPADIVARVLQSIRPLDSEAAPAAPATAGRILVVDDNAANRDLLARRLAREGHRVGTADGGAAALKLVESESFDLILLDLMMPQVSGFEVLTRLKADTRTTHVPVIMISALDEIDSAVRCIEAGAEDYLPKPFNPVLLRARISSSLERKRLRDHEQAIAEELRIEKELSEALLLNILPQTIVDRMRRGETVIADRVPSATILFSDLVDFTTLASKLSAEDTVALLGEVFSRFDALTSRHGLEKIKTIGDGYLVAGGVPEQRPDHAAAVCHMALDMLDAVAEAARETGENLQLRIGIDTGVLVAGVIGTHKFVYDVWGDTVNTAKRMESYGAAGRVHISAATRAALGPEFRCEPRGAIEIKSKGLMQTFFLLGTEL